MNYEIVVVEKVSSKDSAKEVGVHLCPLHHTLHTTRHTKPQYPPNQLTEVHGPYTVLKSKPNRVIIVMVQFFPVHTASVGSCVRYQLQQIPSHTCPQPASHLFPVTTTKCFYSLTLVRTFQTCFFIVSQYSC